MRASSHFRAPRVERRAPIIPLLLILAATLAVIFEAAARYAIGGL